MPAPTQENWVPRNRINGLLLVVIMLNSCALIGCHRGYYRRQADLEASRLIREKATDPRWNSADGTIDIDPQSRMFDPFSQDHPPIPPDDETSHQFMHNVDRKEGYPHWHSNGDTNYVENPIWMSYLPINEKGQVVLTLERAYKLALIHSPELQEQRETLYLSALDVSLERFGFDSQLFSGFNSFLTTQGRLLNGGSSSTTLSRQLGANGEGINLQRMGITGANFAVGLANTILFNFSGNNTQTANSLIDFSLIQPLLQGAGRERILEALTQSERTLLANIRQLERFRRGFYLQVAIGRNPGPGPNLGGNFLGAPGNANFNAGGFFGLLETQQQIRNQEFNVRQLEAVLDQFREFFLRERLDAIQLKLFEGNVYRQQRSLLDAKTNYQASLDDFKLLLGLPPTIDVIIDDPFLDRFELISDEINERMISISNLRKQTGVGLNRIYQIFEGVGDDVQWPDFEWPDDLDKSIGDLTPFIEAAEATLEKIVNDDRKLLEADLDKLEAARPDRIEYLKKVKAAIDAGEIISSVDPGLFEASSVVSPGQLRKALADPEMDAKEFIMVDGKKELPPSSILKRAGILKQELLEVKQRIAKFEDAQESKSKKSEVVEGTESNPVYNDPELYDYIVTEFQERIPGQLSELNNLALELSLLQALARSNAIEISDVDLSAEQAIRIARCMRRDLMNARASLVDQWRNIEFVADQLESQLDLVFTGQIGNSGDNPFRLRADNGELSAGFQFDSPIVRLSERNDYREALIDYQQARRDFYQFEDVLNNNLRDILRNINRSKVLFELDRLTVQVDIQNVEINRFELDAPVSVNAAGSNNRLGTVTSRNLTDAIINLNGSQDSFLGSWVDFEVLRRNLDFDLGTMQLNQNGEWIDPGYIDGSIATRAADMMGVQLGSGFCQNDDVEYGNDGVEHQWGTEDGVQGQFVPAQQFDYRIDDALPKAQPKPGADDGLIDPASPLIPKSEIRGGGSGSRFVPQHFDYSRPADELTVSTSEVIAVGSAKRQRQKLAPRIPIATTVASFPTSTKVASAAQVNQEAGSQAPMVRWESLVNVENRLPAAAGVAVTVGASEQVVSPTLTLAESFSEATRPRDTVVEPESGSGYKTTASTFSVANEITSPAALFSEKEKGLITLSATQNSGLETVSSPGLPASPLTIRATQQVLPVQAQDSKPLSLPLPTMASEVSDPMIVIRASSQLEPTSPGTVRQPADWRKQSSSLDGLLQRFGTEKSPSQ